MPFFFCPLWVLLCGKGEILEMGLICNWMVLSCSLFDLFCLFCFCVLFCIQNEHRSLASAILWKQLFFGLLDSKF